MKCLVLVFVILSIASTLFSGKETSHKHTGEWVESVAVAFVEFGAK